MAILGMIFAAAGAALFGYSLAVANRVPINTGLSYAFAGTGLLVLAVYFLVRA